MIDQTSKRRRIETSKRREGLDGRLAAAACFFAWVAGCHQFSSPFRDELAGQPQVTTPSAEHAWAATVTKADRRRDFEEVTTAAADGTVTHGPLYFEDHFEETEGNDDTFAWTSLDYLHVFYWRARFMANLVAFPVSAVVTPPWQAMESDGYIEPRDWGASFDAARAGER